MSEYGDRLSHGLTMNAGQRKRQSGDDGWSRLAAEIVILAIDDWRELVKAQKWGDLKPVRYRNFDSLRVFFQSEWCAFLMQDFDIDPQRLLEVLEAELDAAKRKDESTNGRIKNNSRRRSKGS